MNESRSIPTAFRRKTEDGTLFIIYDHQLYTVDRTGKPVTDDMHLHLVVTLQGIDDTSGAPGK